jgi:hypothetical protein
LTDHKDGNRDVNAWIRRAANRGRFTTTSKPESANDAMNDRIRRGAKRAPRKEKPNAAND